MFEKINERENYKCIMYEDLHPVIGIVKLNRFFYGFSLGKRKMNFNFLQPLLFVGKIGVISDFESSIELTVYYMHVMFRRPHICEPVDFSMNLSIKSLMTAALSAWILLAGHVGLVI